MSDYKYGLKHYFNLLFVNINLQFKGMYEYKVNFYSAIIKNTFVVLLYLLFFDILNENFGDVIGWGFTEFVIFFYFIGLTVGLGWTFVEDKYLSKDIISGKLNLLLFKPGNPILNYLLYFEDSGLIFLGVYSIILVPLIFFLVKIEFVNFLLGIFLSGLLGIVFGVFYNAINSFDFIIFKSGEIILDNFFDEVDYMSRTFPGNFFQFTKIRYFVALMPTYFVATLIVPIVLNNGIIDLFKEVFLLILYFLIFIIIIIINWNYGLKRYEAFG